MSNKKLLILMILSVFMISVVISAVSAESVLDEKAVVSNGGNAITPLSDDGYSIQDSSYSDSSNYASGNVETTVDDEDGENSYYDGGGEDYGDAGDGAGEESSEYAGELQAYNMTIKYGDWSEVTVYLADNDGNPIVWGDDVVTLKWSDGTKTPLYDNDMYNLEELADEINYGIIDLDVYYFWLNDDDYDWEGYSDYINKPVGTYSVTAFCDDYYNIKPVTFTVKITKGTVKVIPKVYHSAKGDYATLRCTVVNSYGLPVDEGTVTFKINGKEYTVKVRYGVASKKIKLNKAKTYKYTATFNGKNYYSKSASSKIYVYKTSKKVRTFKIGKYKVVVPLSKYKKLINAKNTNKRIRYTFYTGKKITQKVKMDGKWKTKRNVKVNFCISYGGKTGSQDCYANRYCIYLDTKYQNPGYDDFKPVLSGYKSRTLISSF